MQKIKKKLEWSAQEIGLLTKLYPISASKKWKFISKEFEQKGFHRTELECRQKWINFVDPSINNREWEQKQLETLYRLHQKYGTRWCLIQREINRTQNKIKNRFYGTLRNLIRFVLSTLGQKDSFYNYQISKLSPNFLNEVYYGEKRFSFLQKQVKKAIYAMSFKIDKKILTEIIQNNRSTYAELRNTILKFFKSIASPSSVVQNIPKGQLPVQINTTIIKRGILMDQNSEQIQKMVKEEQIQSISRTVKIQDCSYQMPAYRFPSSETNQFSIPGFDLLYFLNGNYFPQANASSLSQYANSFSQANTTSLSGANAYPFSQFPYFWQ